MRFLTLVSRLVVGLLFIFSGFIKANDSIGFSYKLEEYFNIFQLPSLAKIALPLAIFICVVEIVLGIALLIGAYIRHTAWLLLLMIVFFTWLTGFSAVTNKVTDCGCFGDAIKLTPWESFFKDVVLLVLILIIFIRREHIKPFFSKAYSNKLLVVFTLLSFGFSIYCYYFLPAINFLHWKKGNDVEKLMEIPEGAPVDSFEMVFVYEKEGVNYEFDRTSLPKDEGYTFVERRDKLVKKGFKPKIYDFHVYNDDEEITDLLFIKDEYKLILVAYDLNKTQTGAYGEINELAKKWAAEAKLDFWALTSTPSEEAREFKKQHNLGFDFFSADGTALKAMIRSNPGLILLKKSTVLGTWSANSIPSYEHLLKLMK